jgi:predicted PurR-regulated permease PerM
MATERESAEPLDVRSVARAVRQEGERLPERLGTLLGTRIYGAVGLLFLAALIFRFFDAISRVLLIAFVGIIVAMAFNAIVVRLPIRRGIATALVAVTTLALIGLVGYLGISALIPQVRALAEDLPGIQETLLEWEQWLQQETGFDLELIGEPLEALLADPFAVLMALLAQAFGILEIIGIAVLVLFGALFVVARPNEMLLDPMLRAVPRHRRPAFRRMMSRMAERLVGWLRGTILSMIIIGAISGIAFWLVGAPYPLLLGVFVGVVEIIPIVGPWIGGATAVLITAFYDLQTALWVAVAVLIIQQVEGNVVRPFVMAGSAELHPFVTLLGLLLFGAMFGFLGALLALPLVLAIATVIEVLWVEETIGTAEDEIEPMVQDE